MDTLFPANSAEALAMLYLQGQDIKDLSPPGQTLLCVEHRSPIRRFDTYGSENKDRGR